MCGIAGFLGPKQRTKLELDPVFQTIATRGPDGRGVQLFAPGPHGWQPASGDSGWAGLLHTRLSIRDLSDNAAQPMCNEDGSIWLVYNGEIYGWESDQAKLIADGHRFRSSGDSEFILHAYEDWGESVLGRMRGMYSFVIVDLRQQRLFCARDRLGKKPLYFGWHEGHFAFGSTLKTVLHLLPGNSSALDANAIDAYLAHRYIPAPRTLFEGIWKLAAGHKLSCEFDTLAAGPPLPERYWEPRLAPTDSIVDQLRQSTEMRLVSDRPVGLFLSAGIDSRAVAHAIQITGHADQVTAFTASFPGQPRFDESTAAAQVAAKLGFAHRVLPIELKPEDVPRIIADLDEPFADPSAIPAWYLCREASGQVAVALTGDGGDELFAGYKRYAAHLRNRSWSWLRRPRPATRLRCARFVSKQTWHGKLQRLLLERQLTWEEDYLFRFSGFDPLTRSFLQPNRDLAAIHYWRTPSSEYSGLGWMLECDRLNYLPDYILRKGDLCGMAHGLELRQPLLDHPLYEAVSGLPNEQRFTSPSKLLLREFAGCRNETIPKRGFNPPLRQWLREGELAARFRSLPSTLEQRTGGQFDRIHLEILVNGYFAGLLTDENAWQLLVLDLSLGILKK